uniref:Uncharacterized protein n=1 Tax=Lactuca sativa TaxID=4236 RepID=A0A9R1WBS4_LACSA|nr:hypothetical protein LSAT_V11C200095950 [Lactuca sativa]
MNEIKKLEPLAYDHLMEMDHKIWSKAFFQTNRVCDAYENGIYESFNSVIEAARKRSLITMFEEIRIYAMERLYRQKIKGQSWDLTICPSIRLRLSKLKDLQSFGKLYHLVIKSMKSNLGMMHMIWTLVANMWLQNLAVNRDVEDYVSPWFTTIMFSNCYRYTINPLNGSDMWPYVDYIKSLPPKGEGYQEDHQQKEKGIRLRGKTREKCMHVIIHNTTKCRQKPTKESSNPSSKLYCKTGKVKVALEHEVDIESDNEVEMEPDSEVKSFDVEFEDQTEDAIQEQAQAQPEDDVEFEDQAEDVIQEQAQA